MTDSPQHTVLVAVEERPDGSMVVHFADGRTKDVRSPAELWGTLVTTIRSPPTVPLRTTSAQPWEDVVGSMAADLFTDLIRKAAPTVVPAAKRAADSTRERARAAVRAVQRSERSVPHYQRFR